MALTPTLNYAQYGTSLSHVVGSWEDLKAAGRELKQVIAERVNPTPPVPANVLSPPASHTLDDIGDYAFAVEHEEGDRNYIYGM